MIIYWRSLNWVITHFEIDIVNKNQMKGNICSNPKLYKRLVILFFFIICQISNVCTIIIHYCPVTNVQEAFANNLSGVSVDHGGSVSANVWLCGVELLLLDDPKVFQPDGSLTSYVKPPFPNVWGYPSAAVWLKGSASSLRRDSRWSVEKAGVTGTQTDPQMESTGVPSHSPAGGSGRGSSRPRGPLSITSSSFPSFCFSSVAEILTLASTHTHICTCTLMCRYYQAV